MQIATHAVVAPLTRSLQRNRISRVVAAALAGSALEWYDFSIYGTATSTPSRNATSP